MPRAPNLRPSPAALLYLARAGRRERPIATSQRGYAQPVAPPPEWVYRR